MSFVAILADVRALAELETASAIGRLIDMALDFIRRHHLLSALLMLAAAAMLYMIGVGTGALLLVVAAASIELIGWVLLFNHSSSDRTPQR